MEQSTGGGAQKRVVQPKTAVSLLSGSTEAIFALGLEAQLVGRSHECDFPAEAVAKLPACSIALVDHLEPAASIDAQVKKLSESGAPLYTLEAATVGALAPDVLFVQDSCRICAVSPSALQGVELADCEVVVLRPRTLQDVLDDIVTVASALGHRERGVEYVAQMQARIAALARPVPAPTAARKTRVAVLEWVDPLMSCGYWIPELVEAAGCECVLAGKGEHTGYVTLQELLTAAPDQIIIASCGFDVERCAAELLSASAQSKRALVALADAADGIWIADGNRFFNRSGPGVVESAVIVAQAAAAGAPVDGEADMRGTEGFVSLQEALELEGTSLEEFAASIPAEATGGQQQPAAAESVAAVQASAAAVVAALQRGDVQAAYEMSAVSSQMPLDTYKAVIVDGEDYAALSDGSLSVEWIGEPVLLGSKEAKLRVRLGSCLDGDGDVDEACSTYDFRMVHLAAAEGAAAAAQAGWMVKAVSKL
jgi:iron complex transport system substrate-binding protein